MDEEKRRVVIEGQPTTKVKDTYRNIILTVIAIVLVLIAIPTWYDYQLTKQANEDAIAKAQAEELAELSINGASDNIAQAKNTLYEGGIVSILLDSFQKNTEWKFFIANNGKYVVDATGLIPNPFTFLSAIKLSDRIGYYNSDRIGYIYNSISELMDLEPESVKQMKFRIQFVKRLGDIFDTEYDHYRCSYSEIRVVFNDGTEKNINTLSDVILDYFEAYLQDSLI